MRAPPEQPSATPVKCEKPKGLADIRIGDSYARVIAVLGKPTNDDLMADKERVAPVGRRVLYIYQQRDAVFNPRKDCYTRLWFGTDDKLGVSIPDAIKWGNYIPGPGEPDPAFGGGGAYKRNPFDPWGQYP